ncbi:DUF2806 domain-containing protein [Vibrio parahaemolyticus]|nr:DUF2806 domain-containing protein [Vibrio parahaemolyticus]EJG0999885.1 DUF2806 domain-containing protein [Vibrio parahaemolyticus]MBE4020025.1 DUF2806 domain-containing protein [Vibrio parahaemolyticus]MDF5053605.1 DUF2806 domain-containing protein [Vibrio parahaemolyticus]MDF5114249.1 DUF2806 domain-containing protein [Vibrio parahaemolyticus]
MLENFNPTEPATKLIEKISNAIGVLYEPTRTIRMAKAEAKSDKIRALSKLELSEIEQRAVVRVINEETKAQENIESITVKAAKAVSENSQPESIDDDWLSFFFEKCKRVSDEDMQTLWANILAEEANSPRNFSKRAIEAASLLDKREAELFTSLCRFSADIMTPYLFIFGGNHPFVNQAGIDFNALIELEAAGLIKFNTDSGFALQNNEHNSTMVILGYFDKIISLNAPAGTRGIPYGGVMFTGVGRQLRGICNAEPLPGFAEYLRGAYSDLRITVTENQRS